MGEDAAKGRPEVRIAAKLPRRGKADQDRQYDKGRRAEHVEHHKQGAVGIDPTVGAHHAEQPHQQTRGDDSWNDGDEDVGERPRQALGHLDCAVAPAAVYSTSRKWLAGPRGVGVLAVRPDLAERLQAEGRGKVLDQFANGDNPEAHYSGTGPEIWRQTGGTITHFISSMGTTGTIMGTSRYLKEQNPAIQIVGLQPQEGSAIPGIRRWPQEYLPKIYQAERVDQVMDMGQAEAEHVMRRLAREEGIFCGVSSGGSVAGMLRLSQQVENAVLVAIICDRGDRYLSTGVYEEPAH